MLEINKIYGDYICEAFVEKNKANQQIYRMRCLKCNRIKNMKDYVVKQEKGITHKSCGKGIKTEDKIFYSRWCAMRNRTTNDNYWASEHYKNKGINSDEFEYFIDFYDAMYESYKEHVQLYGEENTSLERIDNSKPYSKENCKWATLKEQKQNRDIVKPFEAISPNGEIIISRNVTEFAKEHNLDRATISDVLNGRTKHHKNWKFKYINPD